MTNPKVTVVIPALNEEKVVHLALQSAIHGLQTAGVEGEILVIDSSTDRTPEIAREMGARVISVPRRGLGQAYLDAMPHIRGEYVIMGDADGTYDYREIPLFVQKMDEGYEFVMGTRLKGTIEDGAMPALHRYFGTPLMSFILNTLFGTRFSDINCGLRAVTRSALQRMNLQSTSWEYASEMVLKAALLKLRSTEVPATLRRDAHGRESHHKRSGVLSPWAAGWLNLKMMLLFAPDFVFVAPGGTLLTLGLLLLLGLGIFGEIRIGRLYFALHYLVLGSLMTLLGFQVLSLGVYAKAYALVEYFQERSVLIETLRKVLNLDRGMLLGGVVFLAGLIINLFILYTWLTTGFGGQHRLREAILAMTLMVIGAQIVFSSFFLSVLGIKKAPGKPS